MEQWSGSRAFLKGGYQNINPPRNLVVEEEIDTFSPYSFFLLFSSYFIHKLFII